MAIERQICKMKGGMCKPAEGQDRLGTMLSCQAKFADKFFKLSSMTAAEREAWVKEMCLCMVAEVVELLGEINWKHWKSAKKEIDLEQARFEVADILCFLFNAAMLLGMDAESLFQYYMRKVEINEERQKAKY